MFTITFMTLSKSFKSVALVVPEISAYLCKEILFSRKLRKSK